MTFDFTVAPMTANRNKDDALNASSEDAVASDASLLRRVHNSEPDAAREVYQRYAGRLLNLAANQTASNLAARFDAEDIVQSVFRTFFRRAASGEYDLPDGEELWKLFLVIGLNKVRAVATHHRAAKRDARVTIAGDAYEKILATQSDSDEAALAMLRMTINDALASFPEVYRTVIDLRIAGFEVGEIATRVGRAKRSVERILQECRTMLHGLIHEES